LARENLPRGVRWGGDETERNKLGESQEAWRTFQEPKRSNGAKKGEIYKNLCGPINGRGEGGKETAGKGGEKGSHDARGNILDRSERFEGGGDQIRDKGTVEKVRVWEEIGKGSNGKKGGPANSKPVKT